MSILGGKMRFVRIITAFLAAGFVLGCGGSRGPGGPGSWGTEDTNVIMSAEVRPYDGFAADDYSSNVDVVADLCPDGTTMDGIADHSGRVKVTASRLVPEHPAGVQYIENYTIEFYKDQPGAPPIDTYYSGYETHALSIAGDEESATVEFDAVLVDLERKLKYYDDATGGFYQITLDDYPNYVAKYTFYGKDQYGKSFGFQTQTNFRIGHYLVCD